MRKSYFKKNYKKICALVFLIFLFFVILFLGFKVSIDRYKEKNNMDGNVTFSYVGDLILLMDQVKYSYDKKTSSYNFDYMFKYAKEYFNDVDYSIGVFEGPISNDKWGYSTSNYGDGNKLYMGFPEEFADAVKDSGIDLVTTANNHLMDQGKDGVINTINYLNKIDLDYVGSYKNSKEKSQVKVINVEGVTIAVLSYTVASNYYDNEYFVEEDPSVTSILVSEKSEYFDKVKKQIRDDFDAAKRTGADLIMVMPHMGTQFIHTTDKFQDFWNEIFISYGADIILGDHSHAVQPVVFEDDTLIVNCPGNFANSYIEYDGDATSIVEFSIDKKTKKIKEVSVVPMYTKEISKGKYQAVPVYDVYTDEELYKSFSEEELNRLEEVHSIVTKSMIGEEVDSYLLQKKYFVNDIDIDIDVESALNKSYLKKILDEASDVTFIGDSITHGTRNGFHGWQEPLMKFYPKIKINNISNGSYTTRKMIDTFGDDIKNTSSDAYFIAIGVNDVRYRDEKICAMTSEEYIKRIEEIVSLVDKDDAEIILIAPWMSLVNDVTSELSCDDKNEMLDDYSEKLRDYAKENNYIFVDPNPVITTHFEKHNAFNYMVDYIHPNDGMGIKLYSYAVLVSIKGNY